MIEAPHYAANGKRHGAAYALPAEYFDGDVNEPVLHQAVKIYLANQRQGTHATKTRRWVTGGNQKPWRQKGTGRARQGTTRSPLWPGGGTVFGPHPRDYRQDIPRKVRQLARRSALNARAREGALWVIDPVSFDQPKTAQLAGLLKAMELVGRKVLVLTNGLNRNLYLSGRNLPLVSVLPFSEAAAYDILWSDAVVVEGGALGASPEPAPDSVVGAEAEAAQAPGKKKPAPKQKKAAKAKAATKRTPGGATGKADKTKPPSAERRVPSAEKKKPASKKKGSK